MSQIKTLSSSQLRSQETFNDARHIDELLELLCKLEDQYPINYKSDVLEEVDSYTSKLLLEFNIPKYFSYFSVLTINAYPYLNVPQLILTNNGIAVLWLVDNYIDSPKYSIAEKKAFCDALLNYLQNGKISENKFIALLESDKFWLTYRGTGVAKRYLKKLEEMIELGMKRKFERDVFEMEEYLSIRYYDCGVECCWVFMDFDNEIEETQTTKDGNFVIWAVNDVYSYWKDVVRDKTNYNYLCCGDATFKSRCNELGTVISKTWSRILSKSDSTDEIADKVDIWCRANLVWHRKVPRYSTPLL
jgi:hypothetical protein